MAKLQLGGVSPAVLQLMVGCAQGGVSVVCRMFWGTKVTFRVREWEPERMNR